MERKYVRDNNTPFMTIRISQFIKVNHIIVIWKVVNTTLFLIPLVYWFKKYTRVHLNSGAGWREAKGHPVVKAAVVSKPAWSWRHTHISQEMSSSFKLFRNFCVSLRSCRFFCIGPSFFPFCFSFAGEGAEGLIAFSLATCPSWPLWPCVKFCTFAETTKETFCITLYRNYIK